MLRACHEVLKPGGRIAGYVIHTPPGLSEARSRRATECGPGQVVAEVPPGDLLRRAGFLVIADDDVTEDFRETCTAIHEARHELEDDLRAVEGDVGFEDENSKKRLMLEGISEGLLRRSLLVATRT